MASGGGGLAHSKAPAPAPAHGGGHGGDAHEAGGGHHATMAAKKFLFGQHKLDDSVHAGLHRAVPDKASKIVAAHKKGAKLAAGVPDAKHKDIKHLVNDPAFDWGKGDKKDKKHPGGGHGPAGHGAEHGGGEHAGGEHAAEHAPGGPAPGHAAPAAVVPQGGGHDGAAHGAAHAPAGATGAPAGTISSDKLHASKKAPLEFKKKVYDKQLRDALKSKQFFPGIPDDQLVTIEGEHKLHRSAAAPFKAMMSAIQDAAKTEGKGRNHGVSVASAYRSLEKDFSAWENAFETGVEKTAPAREATGEAWGSKSVDIMVKHMHSFKAMPGFSNHSAGISVDFAASETVKGQKVHLGPKTSQKALWRDSWLHAWLIKNAKQYGFEQLITEEWHWNHMGGIGEGGDVPVNPDKKC